MVTRLTLDTEAFFEPGGLLEKHGADERKPTPFCPRQARRASAANATALAIELRQSGSPQAALRERYAGSETAVADHHLEMLTNSPALRVQPAGLVTATKSRLAGGRAVS